MTKEEFLEIVKEAEVCLYTKDGRRFCYFPSGESPNMEAGLHCRWVSGGSTGKSCWGGDARPVDPDRESEELEESLEKILTKICPNMTFLQYKRLCRDLIEYGESGDGGDYYGNYYDYGTKWLELQKLYDRLRTLELIQ